MSQDKKPLVSIIIPVVNNLAYNRECLESIFAHTPADLNYEIIIVDNNSTDGSREYFQSLGGKVRLLANGMLRTFAESCNQGAREAQGEFLLFLNNDVYVTPNWLPPLLECVQNTPQAGIVGNKHIFPKTGLLSHAGGAFTPQKNPEHIYHFFDPGLPFVNKDRECQWVTACCVIMPRKLFFEARGFDEAYKNSHEDVDLCCKVRTLGYKVIYCHRSVIYHHGQATEGRTDHEIRNQRLFLEKWGELVYADVKSTYEQDGLPDCLGRQHNLERILYGLYHIKQRVDYLEHKTTVQRQQIEAILDTVSWKLTVPIRICKQFYLKQKRRWMKKELLASPPMQEVPSAVRPLLGAAFFTLGDGQSDPRQIEAELMASLGKRKIPLEYERHLLEQYNADYFLSTCNQKFLIRLRLFCTNLPRWVIALGKLFPFYGAVRKALRLARD